MGTGQREPRESSSPLLAPGRSPTHLPEAPPPPSCSPGSSLITLGASTTLAFARGASFAQRRLPLANPPSRNVYSLTLWDSAQGSGPVSLAISFPDFPSPEGESLAPAFSSSVCSARLHSHSHLVSPSKSSGYWQGNPQYLPQRAQVNPLPTRRRALRLPPMQDMDGCPSSDQPLLFLLLPDGTSSRSLPCVRAGA